MKTTFKFVTSTFGLVMFGMMLASNASAGCAETAERQASRTAQFLNVSDHDEESGGNSIVGMWKVKFVSKNNQNIPDGTVIDAGYAQWHSDGTEIMNSSRPPATQNFCLGVWKKTGPTMFKLNHFALSFDLSGNPNGTVNIREEVIVDHRGNKYAGGFVISVFDPNGVQVARLTGEVTGERVTVD